VTDKGCYLYLGRETARAACNALVRLVSDAFWGTLVRS
jgi:hypothetical protein